MTERFQLTPPPPTKAPSACVGAAELSPDGVYRYTLSRTWEPARPLVVWVMLNPSTASASRSRASAWPTATTPSRGWSPGSTNTVTPCSAGVCRAVSPRE